jgi:response regulator RpfG family c-di-GMP phosphodiesterase
MDESQIQIIDRGVLLHDIGKIGIPDELLRKEGKLEKDEWLLMRKHPEIGYRILTRIKFLKGAAELVLHHHELYDGSGYPQGLKGDEINLGARIFAVADTFDTLTSMGPFPTAPGFRAVGRELKQMSGNKLDPTIVDKFLKIRFSEWKEIHRRATANAGRTDILRSRAKLA